MRRLFEKKTCHQGFALALIVWVALPTMVIGVISRRLRAGMRLSAVPVG